jgi:hypothetical protein
MQLVLFQAAILAAVALQAATVTSQMIKLLFQAAIYAVVIASSCCFY